MAKVSAPLHSSEARGACGAHVYNTWRGLHIVKKRSGPTITHSEDQLALRAITAQFTQLWKTLSDTQRAAWNQFAFDHPDPDWTGQPKRISGFNWYIRINIRLQLAVNDVQPYVPPSFVVPKNNPPTDFITNKLDLDTFFFDPYIGLHIDWFYHWIPYHDFLVELYVTPPLSPGRNPTIKQADRKLATWYDNNFVDFFVNQPGRYTCFLRMINAHGIVSAWERCYIDAYT